MLYDQRSEQDICGMAPLAASCVSPCQTVSASQEKLNCKTVLWRISFQKTLIVQICKEIKRFILLHLASSNKAIKDRSQGVIFLTYENMQPLFG